jgi:hypothetical protein
MEQGVGHNICDSLYSLYDFVRNVFRSDKYLGSFPRDACQNVRTSSCKVVVIVVIFNENLNMFILNKNSLILNFIKIRSSVLELLHVDRRTDRRGEASGRIFADFRLQTGQKVERRHDRFNLIKYGSTVYSYRHIHLYIQVLLR